MNAYRGIPTPFILGFWGLFVHINVAFKTASQTTRSLSFLTTVTLMWCGPEPCIQECASSPSTSSHHTYPMMNGLIAFPPIPPEITSQCNDVILPISTLATRQSFHCLRILTFMMVSPPSTLPYLSDAPGTCPSVPCLIRPDRSPAPFATVSRYLLALLVHPHD